MLPFKPSKAFFYCINLSVCYKLWFIAYYKPKTRNLTDRSVISQRQNKFKKTTISIGNEPQQ